MVPGILGRMTEDERTALELAAAHYRWPGARDTAIREQLGLTPTRHAQLVAALLDRPDALAEMPMAVNRLRRLRDARRSARSARC